MLDTDWPSVALAKALSHKVIDKWPEVGDCFITKTTRGYHLIFDNIIGYNKCCKIILQLCDDGDLEKDYMQIRKFRADMTLRVSERWLKRGYNPPPKPVTYLRNNLCKQHDGMIKQYLNMLQIGVKLSFNYQRFCS